MAGKENKKVKENVSCHLIGLGWMTSAAGRHCMRRLMASFLFTNSFKARMGCKSTKEV